jgi:CheY-like chemotaxis protein
MRHTTRRPNPVDEDTELLAALTRLSARLAHEIRNPLASIKLQAGLLTRSVDTETARAGEIILMEVDAMLSVLSSLRGELVDTDLPTPTLAGPPPWTDLAEVTAAVITSLGLSASGSPPADAPVFVPLLRKPLEDLVAALLENAAEAASEIKPGPKSSPLVEYSYPSTGRVALTVTDYGPDLPCGPTGELLDLTKPFFSTKPGHRGLGLFRVRCTLATVGGILTYRNLPGHGAAFQIELPHLAPSLVTGARILVVDDEPTLRRLLARQFEALGATVFQADKAEEALAATGRQSIDVLITDVGLPGLDGASLAGRLDPVPALLISGSDAPPTHLPSSFLGREAASLFLAKPFSQEEILRAVLYLLWDAPAKKK